MQYDELWQNGPRLLKSEEVFRLGTDAVMLAAFADSNHAKSVCDLGCGSGIISILLAFENPRVRIDGIEIQHQAVVLAKQNTELNGLNNRVNIIEGDLRAFRSMGQAGIYDLVVSNPPYFAINSGKSAEKSSASIAREERTCTLSDLCKAAAHFTRWGGKFAMVHRPERMSEVMCCLSQNGLEPKRLRFVQNKLSSIPSLVLIESRRGGNPGLTIEAPLILHNDDGSESYEAMQIYHRSEK